MRDDSPVLCLVDDEGTSSPPVLQCRGPTLGGSTDADRAALATCSLVAGAILVDGIALGDVEAGIQRSRHARTLTGIFQARVGAAAAAAEDSEEGGGDGGGEAGRKQTLVLGVLVDDLDRESSAAVDVDVVAELKKAVRDLYDAAAAERKGSQVSFDDAYDLQIVPVNSDEQGEKVCAQRTE